jgi:hypothetical protein
MTDIPISNGSGGMGLKIDSVKEFTTRITMAQGLSAKLSTQWEKLLSNSIIVIRS